jgi:hypothetical protein
LERSDCWIKVNAMIWFKERLKVDFLFRLNDLDRAHEAKTSIEQRQRDLVLERKNNNVAWETKVSLI